MKFELGEISDIIIHYVGNRLNDDGCILSSQTIELDEILQSVLKEYFLNSFNGNELFHFFHSTDLSLNETYRYVKDIFTDIFMSVVIIIKLKRENFMLFDSLIA